MICYVLSYCETPVEPCPQTGLAPPGIRRQETTGPLTSRDVRVEVGDSRGDRWHGRLPADMCRGKTLQAFCVLLERATGGLALVIARLYSLEFGITDADTCARRYRCRPAAPARSIRS